MLINLRMMTFYKHRQIQFECDTWKRMLTFMADENIHLKNHVAEIVAEERNRQMLSEIEDYQSGFVKIDELIRILRNDVAELGQFIKEDDLDNQKVNNKLSRIRLNIPFIERQVDRMKMSFNSFLLTQS
jgi:hypothetical protein